MMLIQNGTQGPTTPPTKQVAVGTPGYAYGGPPGSTLATRWDPDVANTILAELSGLVTGAGFSLDTTNNRQVLAAVQAIASLNMQVITTGTAFTVPAGILTLDVEAWGGGAGGGGAGSSSGGNGGGGGGYARRVISVTPGQSITATVGAGGTAGSAAGSNGGAGGTTSFGSFVTATGGAGGFGAASGGGTGGTASGGQINFSGCNGGNPYPVSGGVIGGLGGATFCGPAPTPNLNFAGNASPYWGVGGCGSSLSGTAGAVGAAGAIVVRW